MDAKGLYKSLQVAPLSLEPLHLWLRHLHSCKISFSRASSQAGRELGCAVWHLFWGDHSSLSSGFSWTVLNSWTLQQPELNKFAKPEFIFTLVI